MISLVLVCLLAEWRITQPMITKFSEKVAQGPQKKPLDFGHGNLTDSPMQWKNTTLKIT